MNNDDLNCLPSSEFGYTLVLIDTIVVWGIECYCCFRIYVYDDGTIQDDSTDRKNHWIRSKQKKKRKNIFVNYKQRSKSIEWIECASEKKCPTKWMNGTNNVDDDSLLDHLLQSLLEQILENPHFQSWWLWWFLVNCFHNQSI